MATLLLGRRQGVAGFTRHVAIKAIHPHLARDQAFVRMFVDEALLSSKLQHPNIVHVEELVEVGGSYFLIMEYVPGCSLADLVRHIGKSQRRVSPDLAVAIAMRVADGLHAAHEAKDDSGQSLNVVHRDISPQNILLAFAGYIKVIDFGIAKAQTQRDKTAVGVLKGKYRYMSPEQASGKPVDRRTDVYALGIVLWEMLTMKRLFDGSTTADLLRQVRKPSIPPLRTLVPEASVALEEVVMSALATDVKDRPQTAHSLRQKLGNAEPAAHAIETLQIAQLLAALMPQEIQAVNALLRGPTLSARLRVTEGVQRGVCFELVGDKNTWIVGRSPEVDLTLEDLDISRQHLEVRRAKQSFTVLDLKSKNGLFINGIQTQSHTLQHGDKVRIGNTVLCFEIMQSGRISEASARTALRTLTKMNP